MQFVISAFLNQWLPVRFVVLLYDDIFILIVFLVNPPVARRTPHRIVLRIVVPLNADVPPLVVFPLQRGHARGIQHRLSGQQIINPNNPIVFIILPLNFVISRLAGDGLPIRPEVLLTNGVQIFVKFPLNPAVRILQRHRLPLLIKPGFTEHMVFIQIGFFHPVISVGRMQHRFIMEAIVSFPGHQPVFVIFPFDHRAAIHVRHGIPVQIISNPGQQLFIIFPPDLVVSALAGCRITIGVIILLHTDIPVLVKGPVDLVVQIALHLHRQSVHPIPFLMNHLFFAVVLLPNLGVPVRVVAPLSIRVIVNRHNDISEFVQRALLLSISGAVVRDFALQPVVCGFHQPALRLVNAPHHGISAVPEHRRPVRPVIALLVHIAVLIIGLLKDRVSILAVHQFAHQVPIGHRLQLTFLIIGILDGTITIAVRRRLVIFIHIRGAQHPVFLIHLADQRRVPVHQDRLFLLVIPGYGIDVPVLIIFLIFIGKGLPGRKDQRAIFVVVPHRGRLPRGQVLRFHAGEPFRAAHRRSVRPEVRFLRNLPVAVVLIFDPVHPDSTDGRLPFLVILLSGFQFSVPGILHLIDPILIGYRIAFLVEVGFRQDVLVLVRGVYRPGIPLRPDGQAVVGVQVLDTGRLLVLVVAIDDFRVSLRAVNDLFILIVVGCLRDPVSVIVIDIDRVSKRRMDHPFAVQAHIKPLGDLSVLPPVGGAHHMVPVRAQAGVSFRVKVTLLRDPALQGVFPCQDIVPARHPVRVPLRVEISFTGWFGFIAVVFLFHIGVSVRPRAERAVRPIVRVLDKPSRFACPFKNRVPDLAVIIQFSLRVQIGGLADTGCPGHILIFHPGVPVWPGHHVPVRVVVGHAGGLGPWILILLRIGGGHPGVLLVRAEKVPLRVVVPGLQMPLSRVPVRFHPGIAFRPRGQVPVHIQEGFLGDIAHGIRNHPREEPIRVVDRISRRVKVFRPGQLRARGIGVHQRGVSQVIRHDDVSFPVHKALSLDLRPGGIGRLLLQIRGNLRPGAQGRQQRHQKQRHA